MKIVHSFNSSKINTRLISLRSKRTTIKIVAMSTAREDQSKKVLFVCLGNICRSPSAEAVFNAVVEKNNASNKFVVDSCGTGGGSSNWYRSGGFSYHEGDAADSRMTQVAATRGIRLTSRSRPLTPSDFSTFDIILGMDSSNINAIKRAAEHWKEQGLLQESSYEEKIDLMTNYLDKSGKFSNYNEVPDPYYGGKSGFELVLDLLEEACDNLYKKMSSSP